MQHDMKHIFARGILGNTLFQFRSEFGVERKRKRLEDWKIEHKQ